LQALGIEAYTLVMFPEHDDEIDLQSITTACACVGVVALGVFIVAPLVVAVQLYKRDKTVWEALKKNTPN